MTEPSIHAIDAAFSIEFGQMKRTPLYAAEIIQRAIDAATSEEKKRISELEFKLKTQGFCDICWTCSWEPAALGEPEAVELSNDRGWAVCAMCRVTNFLRQGVFTIADIAPLLAGAHPDCHCSHCNAVLAFKAKHANKFHPVEDPRRPSTESAITANPETVQSDSITGRSSVLE